MSKVMHKVGGKWNLYQDVDELNKRREYRFFSKEFMQVFQYMNPYKRRFYGTIVLSIVQALVFLLLPILAGIALDIIDETLSSKTAEILGISYGPGETWLDYLPQLSNDQRVAVGIAAFTNLLIVLGFLLASVLGMALIMRVRIWQNQKIGNNIIYDLQNDLFLALQQQSYSFYDRQLVGDLVARTTSDVNLLKITMSEQLAFFIRQILQFGLSFVVMLVITPLLALISMTVMPVLFFVMYYYRKRMHPAFLSSRQSYGRLASQAEENVTGVRVVRAFGQEKAEIRKFKEKNQDYYDKSMKIAKLQSWFDPVVNLLNQSGLVFVIFIGGALVIAGSMTIGNVFQFVLLFNFSLGPLRFIGVFLGNLSQINAAAERIVEVLNSRSEVEQPEHPIVKDIEGKVEFRNVSFRYPGTHKNVLKNISFTVEPGETIAILGATGSGKTTLVNLIPRLYDLPDAHEYRVEDKDLKGLPENLKGVIKKLQDQIIQLEEQTNTRQDFGEILIDDINVKEYDKHCLRSQVGIVAQETFLFSLSIKENIALSRENGDVTMEEIVNAAKLANIHDFIDSLPEKYETMVGERGVTLSGGQKQRVAIARAIVSKPKILILDDATSSVDVDTEYEIQRNFKKLFKGRGSTTFIISQRLSTIRMADKILVLENGEMAEYGTHESLLERGGIYARIYSTLSKEGYAS